MPNIFVTEVEKHSEMTASDILNWYRNLYCKESRDENAEAAIMVDAINTYFMAVRDAILTLKQQRNWQHHKCVVEAIEILTENHPERWNI